jgi:hypothetical protein
MAVRAPTIRLENEDPAKKKNQISKEMTADGAGEYVQGLGDSHTHLIWALFVDW